LPIPELPGAGTIDPDFHGGPDDRHFSYMPTYVFRAVQQLHLRFTPA